MSTSVANRPKTVHICTLTPGQQRYEAAISSWLTARGYHILAHSGDPLPDKLRAVRECDVCLLVLGPEFGPQESRSFFSHTELEAAEAVKLEHLYVLLERGAESLAVRQEQHDFIRRVKDFKQGWFANNIFPFEAENKSEEWLNRLHQFLAKIVDSWRPPAVNPVEEEARPQVQADAIMICSTGMMGDERAVVRTVLKRHGVPVIDYTTAGAEPVTPRSWVIESARQCRAIFLIMGPDYGSDIPFEGLGATELEFEHAMDARVPVFAFLRADVLVAPYRFRSANADQADFVQRVLRYVPAEQIFSFDKSEVTEKSERRNELEQQLEPHIQLALRRLSDMRLPPRLPALEEDMRLSWYRRRLHRWMGILPHLTHKQGVPLEQVYVTLQTLPQHPIREEKEQDVNRAFVPDLDRKEEEEKQKQAQTLTVDAALQQFPRLVLQGNPGSGKSVALHWYALMAGEQVTAVFITLARYASAVENREVASLEAFIAREERRMLLTEVDTPSIWVEHLRQGRGLLLLDALDEVPSPQRDKVVADIRAFSQTLFTSQARESRIVLTTRSAGFNPEQWEDLFTITEVQSLTPAQQRQLIRYWYRVSSQDRPELIGERTNRIVEVLQRQASLNSWARTPLMLTLLTTLAAVTDIDFSMRVLTKAEVYHLSLRLLLSQWSTLSDRFRSQGLREKEELLLALAWENTRDQRREFLTREDVLRASAHQDDAVGADRMLDQLSRRDGILTRIGEAYTFYHPTFQEYLVATHLASLPEGERRAILERHRLNEQWEEITQLLVSELDRCGQPMVADAVVETLIAADEQPVFPHPWRDPLHLSLARAARCQGVRVPERALGTVGERIAQEWGEILQLACQDFRQHQYLWEQACQAMLDMGIVATYSYPWLEEMFQKWEEVSHQQMGGRPHLPVSAIEALGNIQDKREGQISSDFSARAKQHLFKRLNHYDRGVDDEQVEAALKALFRLGSETAILVRDLFVGIVDSGSWSVKAKQARELAAILLLQLSPTPEELEKVARLGSAWEQDAVWATLSLEPEVAISFLEPRIKRFSPLSHGIRGHFDYKDDTDIDIRAEALEVVRRLGAMAEPLLESILYPAIFDIERNQRLAEEIFLSFGSRAIPILAPLIKDRAFSKWFGELAPEISFQDIVYRVEGVVDENEIKEYLRKGIHRVREQEMIVDQRSNAPHRDREQIEKMQEEHKQKAKLHSLLRSQPSFHNVRDVESYGTDAVEFLDDLCFLAEDEKAHFDARSMALRQLEKLGPLARNACPVLCRLLYDSRYYSKAFDVLDAMKFAAEPALDNLLQLLHHENWRIRARTIRVIGGLGSVAIKALPDLEAIVQDRENQARGQNMLREVTIEALGRLWPLTDANLDDICNTLLCDPRASVRCAAAKVLEQIGVSSPSVIEALYTALNNPSSVLLATDVQEAAARALATALSKIDVSLSAF